MTNRVSISARSFLLYEEQVSKESETRISGIDRTRPDEDGKRIFSVVISFKGTAFSVVEEGYRRHKSNISLL